MAECGSRTENCFRASVCVAIDTVASAHTRALHLSRHEPHLRYLCDSCQTAVCAVKTK